MAGSSGEEASSAGQGERGLNESAHTEGPRVRFSEDLGRPLPKLSIPGNTSENGQSSNTGPQTGGTNPRSPGSQRTRDRGYSLRRTLFNRGVNTQTEDSVIELGEGSSSTQGEEATARETVEKQSKRQPSVVVSPVLDDSFQISAEERSPSLAVSGYEFGGQKDNKSFRALNLPNYEAWVRKQVRKNATLLRVRAIWKIIVEGKPIPPSADGRHIDLDASKRIQLIDERTGKPYIGNTIRSSRYTLWNFLPRQLIFQFSKLANAYFLLISILQMIPGWSTTGSYTTIIPLLLFVTISMAKEGYDDLRRYKLDQAENNRMTLVLRAEGSLTSHGNYQDGSMASNITSKSRFNLSRSSETGHKSMPSNDESFAITVDDESPINNWKSIPWHDVKVGEIIKLLRDDPVPADLLLLYSDGPNGIAYIETMALDGETNLKSKQAPSSLAKSCPSEAKIITCRANIVVEDPNLDLYNFDGRITIGGETLPLTTNEIVFRGSTLRNTTTAVGVVINSGEECRIRMNANKNPRTKSPAMQIITNKIVLLLVVFVVLLALFCTIAYQIWAKQTEKDLWYLDDAHVPFVQIIVGFIILYNTLIPLSLYVSMEIIKVFQLVLMSDVEMYDPVSNTPMICNVSNFAVSQFNFPPLFNLPPQSNLPLQFRGQPLTFTDHDNSGKPRTS